MHNIYIKSTTYIKMPSNKGYGVVFQFSENLRNDGVCRNLPKNGSTSPLNDNELYIDNN